MSLVLAILSFFGAVFLPGIIMMRFLKKRFEIGDNISLHIISSFTLSLCFNFILIYVLVWLGFYTQSVVVGILVIEVCIFVALFVDEIKNGISSCIFSDDKHYNILLIGGICIPIVFMFSVLKFDIFYGWDAVVSWNRWATEWANQQFVQNEGGYSQLYPMLLSLGYVASGKVSSFQAIGVTIYWYFAFVGIIASIFLFKDSLKSLSFGVILGIVVILVFFKVTHHFDAAGYVDMPVAMIILISALCLLRVALIEMKYKQILFYLLLGALCAGISAEIKQAGLFWCVFYIFGLFYLRWQWNKQYQANKQANKKIDSKIIWICVGIVLIFALPWVVIALYKKFYLHINATNMDYTMNGIYYGKGYFERFIVAIKSQGIMALLFFLSLFALKLPNKIFLFFAISGILYFIFWATHLSYDIRNLQAGIPLMVIALSGVIFPYLYPWDKTLQILYKSIAFLHKRLVLIFVGFVALGLVVSPFYVDKILQGEYKRKLTLGGKDTSILVVETMQTRGQKMLVTSNQLIAYVPNFDRKYYTLFHFRGGLSDDGFPQFAREFYDKHGSFYILMPHKDFEIHKDFLKDKIVIGKSSDYILIEY